MNSQYKVLHVLTRMLPSGGAERNTLYSIQGLSGSKYHIDLAVGEDCNLNFAQRFEGFKLIKLNQFKPTMSPLYDLKTLFSLYKIIQKEKYDIVHTHQTKAGILGRLAAIFAKTPIVIHGIHGISFPDKLNPLVRRFYIFLERIIGIYTDYFVSVGKELKDKYIQQKIGKKHQYRIIYSGVELDDFFKASQLSKEAMFAKRRELGLDSDDIIIGNVGRLEPDKGHRYVIEAARIVVKEYPRAKFVFVGDGFGRSQIEKLIESYQLTDNVILTGYRKDIAEVTGIFNLCVFTSLREGLPRVLVEASAAAKPIVTFAVEGAKEVVQSGVNGFVVPLKDVDSLVEKLRFLLDNPKTAHSMGLKGQKIVNENWRIETMQERTIEFYDEITTNLGVK